MIALRILIVEDELLTANDIKENLLKAGYQVSGIARDYEKAIEILKSELSDLALVDIHLNGDIDGIETARALVQYKPMPIIYLTGNSEWVTFERAKLTNPAAYLVKPFPMQELPLQIELAIHKFYNNSPSGSIRKADHFLLSIGGLYLRVAQSEVLYIEADGNYSIFHLTPEAYKRIQPHGEKVFLSVNLGHFVKDLPEQFFYLSRSAAINLDYIDKIEADLVSIKQHKIKIPKGRRKPLLEQYNLITTK